MVYFVSICDEQATSADWPTVIPITTNVIDALSMDSRKRVVSLIIPQLQEASAEH